VSGPTFILFNFFSSPQSKVVVTAVTIVVVAVVVVVKLTFSHLRTNVAVAAAREK
jgi:hypothetical protein